MATANDQIATLAAGLGLPAEAPAAGGRRRIVFDGAVAVDAVAEDARTVRFEAPLGPVPEGAAEAEEFLRRLLHLQLAMRGRSDGAADEAVLAWEPETGIAFIWRSVSADSSDWGNLAEALSCFVQSVDRWRSRWPRPGRAPEAVPAGMLFLRP